MVGWIALILSIVAIVMAFVAFNRAGADVEAIIQEEAERAAAEFRVDFEALEQELREATANQLQNAADDVETDDTATTTQ